MIGTADARLMEISLGPVKIRVSKPHTEVRVLGVTMTGANKISISVVQIFKFDMVLEIRALDQSHSPESTDLCTPWPGKMA